MKIQATKAIIIGCALAVLPLGLATNAVAAPPVGDSSMTLQAMSVAAGDPISRSAIIDRAKTWLGVPYSMSAYKDGYRTDCSGFVSMAWGTEGSFWTGNLHTIATQLGSYNDLKAGDMLLYHNVNDPNYGSHVVLFDRWVGAVGGDFYIYEQTPPVGRRTTWSSAGYSRSLYKPFKYNKVVETGSSVSGDARDEIISLNGDGVVNAFINNGWNGGIPFGGHTTIGQGWNDPSRVRFADVNGDGRNDIVSLNGDGTVSAYLNTGWNGGVPFGGPTTVGWGWNSPDRTQFADINGDGRDEIISLNADGTVVAYLNNGGATPYSTGTTIGTGWTDHTRIKFADVNGDGRDEIISMNADGTVNSYTNNGWNGGIPFGGSTTVGWGWNSPDRTHFADINGDSRDEIISVNSDGTVSAYLNNGGATPYSTGTTIATGWTDHTRVKFA